ncbi:MAG: hypothetical protein ACRDE7_14880, partial [Sphingobacterium sp.]
AQIMLSGHLHKHILQKSGNGINFPVLVNSNMNLIQVDINADKALFKVLDQSGKLIDEISINSL